MAVFLSRRAALVGMVGVLGFDAGTVASAAVAVGQPAPDFTLTDSDGRQRALADLKGRLVVLEWTNHDCPYVGKHYRSGNMQALQAEATGQGVVWLSVVSSAPGRQGYVAGLEANMLTEQRNAKPSAVLLDPTGSVGRLYGATATPHMFIVDREGRVAYAGAVDDKPSTNPADVKTARNYVREALAALAAGAPVKVASTRAYGCSVKYR